MVEVFDKLKFFNLMKLRKKEKEKKGLETDLPMHVAFTMQGIMKWAEKNKVSEEEALKNKFLILKNTIKVGVKLNIPILTFHVLSTNLREEETDKFTLVMDVLVDFFEKLAKEKLIHENKVKISVWGKWYDLPGRVVEPIKKLIDETSEYDNFFVNLCINYDGQEEIVDSMRLIARQIISHKIGVDSISKDVVKENLYSSYFLPPDLIIKTGKKKLPNLLLWDSVNSMVYFSDKFWPDFDKSEFNKAIDYWRKNK